MTLSDAMLARIAHVCARFEVDGLRADLVIARAARANTACHGRVEVTLDDVRVAARLALPHRRRRGPLEQPGIDDEELERALTEPLNPDDDPDGNGPDEAGPDGDRPDPDSPSPSSDPDHTDDHDREAEDRPVGRQEGPRETTPTSPSPADAHRTADSSSGVSGGEQTGSEDTTGMEPSDQDPEHEDDGGGAGAVHAIGSTSRPPLLTVPGRGHGARGRRSASVSTHGAAVGARPLRNGEPTRDLAIGATMHAAAPHQRRRQRQGPGLVVRSDDLRTRVRQGSEGNLVVFIVDASASMGARRRMEAVKGAVRSLLLDAYQRRDRLALVTFRGRKGEVTLPPTSSVDVADQRLSTLPVGGRTPLAAGLARAGELVDVETRRDAKRRPLLVVLTDGRANVGGPEPVAAAHAQGQMLAERGLSAVVVDTEDGFVRLGLADRLAEHLAAPIVRLDDFGSVELSQVVRTAVRRPPTRLPIQ